MRSEYMSFLKADARPLLLNGVSCLAVIVGFASPATAGCTVTGNVVSSQCGSFTQYLMDEGISTLTVSGVTTSGIEFAPHSSVTNPTTQTLRITGSTIVNNPTYSAVYSQTNAPNHNLTVIIGPDVSVTARGGGFGGVWLRNDISGDIAVTSDGTVFSEVGAGITAVTNDGAVTLTNNGTVSATTQSIVAGNANFSGLYAENGGGLQDVVVLNAGTVTAYHATIRAINYNGLAKVTNTGTLESDALQGIVVWSDTNSTVIANSGSVTTHDSVGIQGWAGKDVTITNSGTIRASSDDLLTLSTYAGIGVQAISLTNGDVAVENTASGVIRSADSIGIEASTENDTDRHINNMGNVRVTNAGTVTGANGVSVWAANGSTQVINSGTITGTAGYGVNLADGTLDNSGTITGSTYGVMLNGTGNTLTSSGRITGTTGSVYFGDGGNTLNIQQGSVFSGVVNYNGTIGNTTTFGVGSYSIPASNYINASNTITLNNSKQFLVLNNASSTGTINVVALSAGDQSATQYTASVSDVVGSILSLDVARPDQITVGGSTISALQYGEEKRETKETKALRELGDGLAVDGYGNLFWARAFGGLRYQQDRGGDPASHTSHYGVISGVDHQFENYRLGFFGGAGSVRTATSGGASVTTGDTGFLGVYGALELHGLQWNASLTGGAIDNKASRSINGGAQTASGDFMGWYISPEVAVSTTYRIAPQWELTPSAKLRYTGAFYDAYDESGSSQNVSYDSRDTHSLDGRLQLELKHKVALPSGLPASLIATAALGDTQYLGSGSTHASLQNNEFTVSSSADRNVVGASLGVGFDAMVSTRAAVYGSIDGTLYSDDSMSASGRLGLKVAF